MFLRNAWNVAAPARDLGDGLAAGRLHDRPIARERASEAV